MTTPAPPTPPGGVAPDEETGAAAGNAERLLPPEPAPLYVLPQPDAEVVGEIPVPQPRVKATYTPAQAPTPRAPDAPDVDVSGRVGAEAYGVMANGLEATTGDASNERTGAFGFSQIMPMNLIGGGERDENGVMSGGWDQAFINSEEGEVWRQRFESVGMNPDDPIPDSMATYGKDDPNVLPSWYRNMPSSQQRVTDGFMRDTTQHQLGAYYNTALKDGAGPKEALERTFAGWYGGSAWLDNDNPKYALDEKNPAYTRGHGEGDQEPSIQEYVKDAIISGNFDFLKQPEAQGQPQENRRVDVHIRGLDRVQVEGLKGGAAAKVKSALSDVVTTVSQPDNHRGF